jgi:hypothetical protein
MRQLQFLIAVWFIVLSAAAALCAEPETDTLMGKVILGSKLKPDTKGRKGVAAIASKIMKLKGEGSIRIRGDFPGADNSEDYLFNSVVLAREIEQQIKPLLKNRFQIYLMSSKYSGEKRNDPNTVEIFFYPRELRVEDMDALRHISTQQKALPKVITIPEDKVQEAVQNGYEPVGRNLERAETDDHFKGSKKIINLQGAEDPTLANELVNRAKARAAEKAKRRERESTSPQ